MPNMYWRSTDGGAMGVAGPWYSPAQPASRKSEAVRKWIRQIAFLSFLLAFGVGLAIGVYQNWWSGGSDARGTAALAYQTVGQSIDGLSDRVINLLPLGDQVATIAGNVLFYLEIPYQLCAFAGGYAATTGLGFMSDVLAAAASHL
jgi:hypothetical protein